LLITGSSGALGSLLARDLRASFVVRGLDRIAPTRSECPEAGTHVDGDASVETLTHEARGAAAIIHLAGEPTPDATWRAVVANNVELTYRVLEAAVAAGVPRVVLASSNHVTGGFELDPPYADIVAGCVEDLDLASIPLIRADAAIRPDSYYGVSKAAVEALGRLYSDLHGLHVVSLRIGSVELDDDPTKDVRYRATWCSCRDFVGFVTAALSCPEAFVTAYCVSDNPRRFWEVSDVLGYRPIDSAEAVTWA
jgi:uronate dehydrogenase